MEVMEFEQGNLQEEAPPQRLQKKKFPKKSKWFAVISVIVLAVVLLVVLLDSTAFDGLRRGILYIRADKDASGCAQLYQYADEADSCFASIDGSLIKASQTQVQVLGEDGTVRYTAGLKFQQCAISCSDSQAAVYDIGGTEITVLDAKGLVRQLSCEGAILSANLNERGYLAVTVNKSGYKAAVYVYNPDGELVFEFDSSERFIMTAAVSRNGRQVALVTMGQSDGTFVSSVVIYKLNSDEPYATCDLPGDAVYQMGLLKGKYCAVTEDTLYLIQSNGTCSSYDYSKEFLRRCVLSDKNYAVLLLGAYKSGNQGRLVTLGADGEEIASLDVDSEVLSLSAAGRYVAVLYGDHLTIYNKKLQEVATLSEVSAADEVLMRQDGSAVLAGNEAASLYLP